MNKYILLSIPFFIIHAIEEMYTDFHLSDQSIIFLSDKMPLSPLTIYFLVQIALALIIIVAFYSRYKLFKVILGFVFIVELTHIASALISLSYTSGLYTSIPLVIIGVFYWKTLFARN